MTTMFDSGTVNPENLFDYDQASISPNTPLFPADIFNLAQDPLITPGLGSDLNTQHPYLSRPPSLSPASQSSNLLQLPHSPHSTASPRSVFSTSTTDDILLNNSFSSTELDQLLYQTDFNDIAKSNQTFFLPQNHLGGAYDGVNLFDLVNSENALTGQNNGAPQPFDQWNAMMSQAPIEVTPAPTTAPARKTKALAARAKSDPPAEDRAVGKHNKTERRYRQKVQAAQTDLRDAVPALRVLYGTSTEEQKRTTDIRAADGTVDGLGEFNRPNASAKTTIFIGARLYIEHLQRQVASLQRKVSELEDFRAAVAGPEDYRQWKEDFEMREALIRAATVIKTEDESFDEDDESEEEAPKKKKARVTKAKKSDVRSFAAFAVTFSVLPSFFRSATQPEEISHVYQPATTAQVFQRLPLITAQHATRLLARALPSVLVPSPTLLVEWTWRIMLAIILAAVVRPILRRFMRGQQHAVPLGGYPLLKDMARAVTRQADKSDAATSLQLAADVVGGVTRISPIARYHLALRVDLIASDAQSLAILAMLQPTFPLLRSPVDVWSAAKAAISPETPTALRQVLALDLDEAKRALQILPPTSSPITAMAEQITLVHLNDLFSRFFVQIVDAATASGQEVPGSVRALLHNLETRHVGHDLRHSLFNKEIRGVIAGVPRGTAAHALGLVLIGLWGLLTGPPPSAQAALASALAAEEVKGVGASLRSVGALRELFYPGSGITEPVISTLPGNAVTIDKLALVCIQFIQLLATTTPVKPTTSRVERLSESRRVQKVTSDIRLVLTQTSFVGMDEDVEIESFEKARARLVTVLSQVGRRAAGRASGADLDSGIEGDGEEL